MELDEEIAETGADGARAVVVEFDSTVMDGGRLLFETAAKLLQKEAGIELTRRMEARWLLNRPAQAGFSALLQGEKGASGGAQLAQTFLEEYATAADKAAPAAATAEFKAFLKALAAKGVKTAVVSRCNPDALRAAFANFPDDGLSVLPDENTVYGNLKREGWLRVCRKCSLRAPLSLAITGSGFGVRGAIQAGMSALAMPNAETEWQDFTGASADIKAFDESAVREALAALHLA